MTDSMTPCTTQPLDASAQAPAASAATSDAVASLTGIERVMADALIALDRDTAAPASDPGAIEYASWLRLLRRARP